MMPRTAQDTGRPRNLHGLSRGGSCSVCNESTDDDHYDYCKSKLYCTKCYDETQGAHQTHARRTPDALEEASYEAQKATPGARQAHTRHTPGTARWQAFELSLILNIRSNQVELSGNGPTRSQRLSIAR